MRSTLLVYLALLGGCTSVAEFTPTDRYENIMRLNPIEGNVQPLPERPKLKQVTVSGEDGAFLSNDGIEKLLSYKEVAETNTDAATLLVTQYNTAVVNRNTLLELLKAEEKRANFYNQLYVETENLRREQQKQFLVDSLVQKVLLLVLTGMLVVQ